MPVFEERVRISEFNVFSNGTIGVRKTTDVLKDEEVISSTHWRCVLDVNDSRTSEVLGDDPYYFNLAQQAWTSLPTE